MADDRKTSAPSWPRLIGLGLALITLLVYLPVRHNSFVRLDDADYVAANPMVQAGLSWPGVVWAFTTYHANNWHPLTWLSHMLDWQLFGPYAGAHHLVSVLFHIVNTVLWYCFWHRTTRTIWPAAVIAALFAWHPLHVESVAWASERKDVLSAMFFILTLIAYHRYARDRSDLTPPTLTSLFSSRKGWLVVGLFALGLMAKPMLVTVPFVLLLLDYWPLQRLSSGRMEFRRILALAMEKIPLFILSAVSCVLTYQAQRADAVVSLEQFPFPLRLGNALGSYAQYLIKTFWPLELAVFYPLPSHLNYLHVVLGVGLLLGLSFVVCRAINSRRYLAVGWFWFLGTLVPVIGLLQVGEQALADRYTYIPLIGIFVMLAYGGRDLVAFARVQKWAVAGVTGVVLVGCLVATSCQVRYWKDSEALFRRALDVTKDNAKAHQILGFALAGKGQQDEAAQHLQIALRLAPRLYGAHNDLAVILESRGKTSEALEHYQAAVRLRPQNATFQVNLALLLIKFGRLAEARVCLNEAIRLEPKNSRYYYLRGSVAQNEGRSAEAIRDFRAALLLTPDDFDLTLELCRMLASDPSSQVRNGAEAVALAERLNQLTRGEHAHVLDALAMAYAETGQFDRASALLSRTLSLIPAASSNAFVGAMQVRLKLYQAHLPYRESPTNLPPARPPGQTPTPAP